MTRTSREEFEKQRDTAYEAWRSGYGEHYVRPKDAFDRGAEFGWAAARAEVAKEITDWLDFMENEGCLKASPKDLAYVLRDKYGLADKPEGKVKP